jgi:AraC-like DNA-binding protein
LQLSASYFSTIFKKATGMPPMDYFIQLKMQKACQLLYLENMKVKDVAEAIGYEDPFYFSRQFKKHMKISPVLYKEASRRHLE